VFDELLGPDRDQLPGNTSDSSQTTPINVSMDEGDVGIANCLLGLLRANNEFIISNGGYMGFVPTGSIVGDRLCILFGCPMPLVVRPNGDKFELIGKAYIYGMMQGEMVQKLNSFNGQLNLGGNVAENPDIREICLL
jgi:hypothetical protein